MDPDRVTAEARYGKLVVTRSPYESAAEASAQLTVPFLFPTMRDRDAYHDSQPTKWDTYTPWQNLGSRGVNNIASKLLLALFPPGQPFFRFLLTDKIKARIKTDPKLEAAVEQALAELEGDILEDVEVNGFRVDLFELFRHLVVAGNYLFHLPEEGGLKAFSLSHYVVKRDRRGKLLELVIREGVDRKSADERVRKILESEYGQEAEGAPNSPKFLYTHVSLQKGGKRYLAYQEVCKQVVPGSSGYFPLDVLPWRPLRFRKVDGEDYGRGLVEENIGDLKALESLTKSIVEAAAASAKLLFWVRPGAITTPRELAGLPNGEFYAGMPEDVGALQIQKAADLQVAQAQTAKIEESLKFVFLLNTAIQRAGERVTAEEVRYMAGELEDALGGVYSILTQELQLPLVKLLMNRRQRAGTFPPLRPNELRPVIVTGLEAIGRGYDVNRLRGFADTVGVLAKIDPSILRYVDAKDMLRRMAVAHGVEPTVIKSDEQVAAEDAAIQQQSMNQAVVAEGAKGLGKGLGQGAVNVANQLATPQGAEAAQQMMAQYQAPQQ